MALKDIFQTKQNKEELERAKTALQELGGLDYLEIAKRSEEAKKLLETTMQKQTKVEADITQLEKTKTDLEAKLSTLKEQIGVAESVVHLDDVLAQKQAEILVADDTLLMESFSLYKPVYAFTTVEEYKDRLDKNREQQKRMLREGTAATGDKNWSVSGSKAQGRAFVDDMIKLCLRTFNNECEAAVSSVKFNNFERCKQKIDKSAQVIQDIAKMLKIVISQEYLALKYEELSLALEYEIKKKEEKERLKELKAQQREEARAAKELEDARRAAIKEQKHYQNAYDTILKQINDCKDETELETLKARQDEIVQKLGEIEGSIKQIDYRTANQKAGYVYVISNIGSFGEDVYKIGMTRRLDPQERVDELGDASVPFNFDIHALIFSDDAPKLEAALHKAFEDKKLNMVNTRREFFHVTLDEIKQVVHANHDKTVEFIEIPPADQYRQSLKMLNEVT